MKVTEMIVCPPLFVWLVRLSGFRSRNRIIHTLAMLVKRCILTHSLQWVIFEKKSVASTGNRTRAARVAGEHSTTEPSMLCIIVT